MTTPINEYVQRYELILRSMNEGVYGLDRQGVATFINPAAERLTGWSAEETIGKPIHSYHHHTKPDGSPYPQIECPIFKTAQTGVEHKIGYELFWRKDGSSFPVEYSSTPIFQDGELVGAVVVFQDISERKLAEQKLQIAFDQVKTLTEKLEAENRYLKDEIEDELELQELIGDSPAFRMIQTQIEQVAKTDATVLIQGESGTGKEMIAHAIYQASHRKNRTMVKVNCGAIPTNLVESELFGHEKGAFTGAIKRHIGRFELANGGTLFLDEVGELPLDVQVKLLRVLQEGEFERVGGTTPVPVDVRVIAATNRDLRKMVDEGSFRTDLYYRLNVFPMVIPPLRDRKEDLPALIRHRLNKLEKQLGKQLFGVSDQTLQRFSSYRWPGNIRELNNLLERAAIVTHSPWLEVTGFEPTGFEPTGFEGREFEPTGFEQRDYEPTEDSHQRHTYIDGPFDSALNKQYSSSASSTLPVLTMAEAERQHILEVLERTNWVISGKQGAADLLDLPPSTLRSRMKKLRIVR
ncbi:sigma-54 interaction domain-containing protein [Litoribrevibacter albus]|uniref:Sigma-54-dependent Fis family transcriptional regulator n=1 Tax=Litoribrevibacter albus TaxID=1473156 RepID=A0AA37S7L9_9GAMM|nr:sigma 54-interacting transcriptional regulator [Litoribrevibacter albus]GLQ29738.1 sigma-54-dependent Fis family transcriptional regulator [Litoribrevibacter albus]